MKAHRLLCFCLVGACARQPVPTPHPPTPTPPHPRSSPPPVYADGARPALCTYCWVTVAPFAVGPTSFLISLDMYDAGEPISTVIKPSTPTYMGQCFNVAEQCAQQLTLAACLCAFEVSGWAPTPYPTSRTRKSILTITHTMRRYQPRTHPRRGADAEVVVVEGEGASVPVSCMAQSGIQRDTVHGAGLGKKLQRPIVNVNERAERLGPRAYSLPWIMVVENCCSEWPNT
jgi:hypothetical protein